MPDDMPGIRLRTVETILARCGSVFGVRSSRLRCWLGTVILAGSVACFGFSATAQNASQERGTDISDDARTVDMAEIIRQANPNDWIELFNGTDLSGWTPKIRGYEAGVNFADTFRVQDGLLTVAYDGYERFGDRFGHLFYRAPFSHYLLRVEYRFVGEQAPGAPEWAIRNSGVMVHAQAPGTMPVGQDFPISLEVQFLGGLADGQERPTGNMCSPGTHIVYKGQFTETHCIDSTSPTFDGDQWVVSETLVLADERVVHSINGEQVIEYGGLTTGGGVVSGHDPAMKPEGQPLSAGYIALQSEGHPVQFRRVELLNLEGCMDPAASAYRAYFIAPQPAACGRQ